MTPTTKAGRALLIDWEEWRQGRGKSRGRDDPFAMRERLAATEAQAAQQERERLTALRQTVLDLPHGFGGSVPLVSRDAVLRKIDAIIAEPGDE